MFQVIAFYKYVKMKKPKTFAKEHLQFCKKLESEGKGFRARILVGNEGLNGVVCGNQEQIKRYKKELAKNADLKNIMFKETKSNFPIFKGIWVRHRKEIVALGAKGIGIKTIMKKAGKLITPEKFKKLIENEKGLVLLDARNNYEWRIGKFKDALVLDIDNFREFPDAVKKLVMQNPEMKNKKILMYCTGGIRCEKASAVVKKEGLKNVYQLEGGIHAYADKFPDTHWEGKLFVFDDRLAIDVNEKNKEPITNCDICNQRGDIVLDCSNKKCHEMFVCCKKCKEKFNGTCHRCITNKIPAPICAI